MLEESKEEAAKLRERADLLEYKWRVLGDELALKRKEKDRSIDLFLQPTHNSFLFWAAIVSFSLIVKLSERLLRRFLICNAWESGYVGVGNYKR
jgi:hypothetical protein